MRKIILIILTFYISHGLAAECNKNMAVTLKIMQFLKQSKSYTSHGDWKPVIYKPGANINTYFSIHEKYEDRERLFICPWPQAMFSLVQKGLVDTCPERDLSLHFELAHHHDGDVVVETTTKRCLHAKLGVIGLDKITPMHAWADKQESDSYTHGGLDYNTCEYLYDSDYCDHKLPLYYALYGVQRNDCERVEIKVELAGKYYTKLPLAIFKQELEKE